MHLNSLEDVAALKETEELECKLAAGREGKGEIPKSFWETYSAFANSKGGYIVLGMRELADGSFRHEAGIDASRLQIDLFNLLSNSQKVSANLLKNDDVQTVEIDGSTLLVVRVPQATRRHKPVYIGGNPLTGTYRRVHEGDRLCDPATVRAMLAEQTEDTRDNRVLHGFDFSDLNPESIDVYRRQLRDSKPGHPFLDQPTSDFLRSIGAWRKDRETGKDGLTVAGLLMFGTSETIREEFPNYALDFQERDEPRADRWVDRLTPDGTWSGNLFDFYRLVWRKLTTGLKAPFKLKDGQRVDDTPVHVALREALVNAIVHADYTGRASLLVVKRPDMFGFRNPGLMRVPVELAVRGGESDGRNRTLQQMFLLIGAGERAGSGVPKIHQGWRDQHWRPPSLFEKVEPSEQTLLELHMEDLLPPETVDSLREAFGKEVFDALNPEERVVLVTAALEITISHSRAMSLCGLHPTDMTRLLQGLVQRNFLVKSGQSRGSKYHLPGVALPDPDTVFAAPGAFKPTDLRPQPTDLVAQPTDLNAQGSELANQPPEVGHDGRYGRVIEGLTLPVIDDLDELAPDLLDELREIAAKTGGSGKVQSEIMRSVIVELCSGRYLTLRVLAKLLSRVEDYLRNSHLNQMAADGTLHRAFPQIPNHPRQAYTSTSHQS